MCLFLFLSFQSSGLSSVGRGHSGDDRPASTTGYDDRRLLNGGAGNVYERPVIGRDGRQGAGDGSNGMGPGGAYGRTVLQHDYRQRRLSGDDDDASRGDASTLLTDNVTTQEVTLGKIYMDGFFSLSFWALFVNGNIQFTLCLEIWRQIGSLTGDWLIDLIW